MRANGEEGDMKARAAIFDNGPRPRLAEIDLPAPGANDVLVRLVATGICHTDTKAARPGGPVPHPVVLGHEGAGIVEKVGDRVSKVSPGDHVVLTFSSCGACASCREAEPAFCHEVFELNFACRSRRPASAGEGRVHIGFFGQSSFATHALVQERNAVVVDKAAPLELLGPLGCGFQTGAGAVINDFRLRAGDSIAVFGAGGVGMAAIMAARLSGAGAIIAVDRQPDRLELAAELGATLCLNAETDEVVPAIMAATRGGVNFALDTTGVLGPMRQAIDVLAPRGECGFVTGPWDGAELGVPVRQLLAGRRLRGIHQGSSNPDMFIPRLVGLHLQGRFPIDRLARFYDFAEIGTALDDMEAGRTIKPILRFA